MGGFVTRFGKFWLTPLPTIIFVDFDHVKNHVTNDVTGLIAEEMAMAFILDKYGTGMALLKQDSNGDFKRLRTNENLNSDRSKNYTANNCP